MSFLESPFNPMATFETQATLSSTASLDPKLSRTHYYDGRLLKASDLTRDQFYLDERLNEVGRVLGQGVVRGLQVRLNADRSLNIETGLAIAPSGRVLELETKVERLNLTDDAQINSYNPNFRSLQAGLYALVIRYAQKGVGTAEVFPKDLESQRGFYFNAYQEGVEFALQRLALPLPLQYQQQLPTDEVSLYARAQLVRPLLVNNPGQPVGLDENSVALGLLAVEKGIPQWFDQGLLRRPFRSAQALNYVQVDLYNHYEELLRALLEQRQPLPNREQFLAQRYFSVLPPVGAIPKGAVDPVNGYQHFFPAGYEVSISPLREDDVAAVVQQSMALEPIDLQRDRDVDIMIAVVLDDNDFAYVARQLQHLTGDRNDSKTDFVHPPHLDEFFLGSASLNSAASDNPSLWKNIWEKTRRVFYVRRPIRVAETQVSAIVLASGTFEDLKNSDVFKQQLDAATATNVKLEQKLGVEINEKLTALALNQSLSEQIALLNQEIATLNADIKELQENAASSAELEAAQQQIAVLTQQLAAAQTELDAALNQAQTLQKQLASAKTQVKDSLAETHQLQQFVVNFLEPQAVKWESLESLAKLRAAETREAQEAAQKLLDSLLQDSDNQQWLVQLLVLMPARFDTLNWPSLLVTHELKLFKELREHLRILEPGNFLELMFKFVESNGFPAELQAAWKKLLQAQRRREG
jgi:hypothetical protein